MVTFAQAQERGEEWINGDLPAYQHREVRVREFDLGFVVWAEDRPDGPRVDGGSQRLVIARDSGDATLWPALPVGEVIRRYEEEYARAEEAADTPPTPPARVDLNQTSFLLTPPEWLQEAADQLGIPDRPGATRGGTETAAATDGAGRPVPGDGAPSAGGGQPSAPPPTQAGVPVSADAGSGADSGSGSGPGAGAGGAGSAEGASGTRAARDDVRAPGGAPWAPAADSAPGATSGAGTGVTSGAGAGATPGADGANAGAGAQGSGFAPGGASGGAPADVTPWAGTDITPDAGEDVSVPLPATVFAPPLSGSDDESAPPAVPPDAQTALMQGGSGLPPTAVAPALDESSVPGAPGVTAARGAQDPPGAHDTSGAQGAQQGSAATPSAPLAPDAPRGSVPPPPPAPPAPSPSAGGDIADAATSKAAPPPRRAGGTPPPPPPAPPVPSASASSGAPSQEAAAKAYVPTQLVSSLEGVEGADGGQGSQADQGAQGRQGSVPPPPPPPPAPSSGGAHHAATVLADQAGPGAPKPPAPPGPPNAPVPPAPPGPPPAQGGQGGGTVHHAETVLAAPPPNAPRAAGPGVPPPPPPAPGPQVPPPGPAQPAYGYPQQGQPMVGPGYQAVLRYRAQDGSEQQLIRRSAPGLPHPEWQIFHELRAMNVPPDQVLELHTELEPCELPGAYCARMIREQWPQARLASIAPYGTDHAGRQQGMRQLLAHQGELHQVADGPARPGPVRVPLPPVQPVPPVPPEAVAQELAAAFGPGVFRFEPAAVSRQGVPQLVAHSLVVAGLPVDMGPFFWAQAQPGRPVPTLAELARERGVQAATDAASYLVMGTDFGKALCVQYGTAHIVAVPVEAGPGGAPNPPQFVNTGLLEFQRCLALLGRMWRLRYGLNQEQAGRWTVDFQAQLAALDPAALGSPESWWSVLLEQMWDGLL